MQAASRRAMLRAGLVGGATMALPAMAAAQAPAWPDRPITFVVPFGAGGAGDTIGRLLAEKLAERLGKPVVIETRAGGNGVIGSEAVARARADGHTVLLATSATHAVNPALRKSLPYNPVTDFAPVALLGRFPFMGCVNPKLGVRTLAELVALGKARSDKLNYGYWTPTSLLMAETFGRLNGFSMVGVSYRATPAVIADLIAGRIDFAFVDVLTGRPFVQSGEAVALAATTAARTAVAPDLATVQELGFGPYDIASWLGLFAPGATPPAIVARLSEAVVETLRQPAISERLLGLGFDVQPMAQAEFTAYARRELDVWRELVERAGLEKE